MSIGIELLTGTHFVEKSKNHTHTAEKKRNSTPITIEKINGQFFCAFFSSFCFNSSISLLNFQH